ncbi:MAG: hypothetical protein HDR94_04310 [Bacteroides sp.]|nr:hypothetical protein [Bacteroides sp.]
MTQVNNAKPIWLDLKKEYVDDNFDALLNYIHNNRNSYADPFYNTTLDLVKARVEDVLQSIAQRPVYLEDIPQETLIFNIRLLACHLLTFPSAENRTDVLLAMLHNTITLVPKYADELIAMVGNSLKFRKLEKIGVSYNDIIRFQKEIFTHKLCEESKFADKITVTGKLDGNGRIWQTGEGLTITAPGERSVDEKIETLAFSLDTGIGCRLGSFKGEQLKTSESSVFAKMTEFLSSFLKAQEQPLGKSIEKKKLRYAAGEDVVLRVVEVVTNFQDSQNLKWEILVETTDPDYEYLQGKIVYSGPYFGVYLTNYFGRYFRKGDYVCAQVVSPERRTFSIEKQLKEFLVEDTRERYQYDTPIHAQLINQVNRYFNWLGENGANICTYCKEGFEPHDLARLHITMYEYGKNYGKINAEIEEKVTQEDIVAILDEEFDANSIREATIRDFIESTPAPREVKPTNNTNATFEINPTLLPYIIRIFYSHQRNLPNPTERLRYLANAMALAEFLSDMQSLRFLQFSASYLQAIVSFASNDNIHDIGLPDVGEFADAEAVKLRCEILELLKEYGKSEYSQKLNDAITANPEEQPLLSKLARLIHAANSVRETLSAATLNALKREIVKTLSIETDDDVEIDSETRPYLGTESQTVEFKTSLVYPPDNNMQPNLTMQSTNIFKAICGFLNSSIGGTLYIGVNDQGYVTGLSQDMYYLKCQNFDTFSRRHIIDPLIKLLGKEVMTYVHIDAGFDEEVAVIKVDPFPFGVVEMNGIAYVRVDRETRQMTDRVKAQITHEKLLKDRDKANNLLNLQQAKFNRCVAILHDYASSNGGTIANREVEVFEVLPEDGLAACFDLKSRSCKFFSITRMKYVEVTDRSWQNEHLHKNMPIDAFRISGELVHSVSLQLDLHAKNLLIEQYPRTKDDISKDAKDTNVWYYSGKIAGPEALARFYIGLADHIKILDAPILESYIADYTARYLHS